MQSTVREEVLLALERKPVMARNWQSCASRKGSQRHLRCPPSPRLGGDHDAYCINGRQNWSSLPNGEDSEEMTEEVFLATVICATCRTEDLLG